MATSKSKTKTNDKKTDAGRTEMRGVVRAPEAARLLGVSEGTLANWRSLRKGPKFARMGTRTVVYPLGELQRYIDERTAL
ncbi:helix-turn-helix transcriptional regulator [Thermophilibacter provencensis]|uniref:Helix-turn-helix domain-containing protein n=1 Tax=Thermophilibacter provencensis TaxID=1852386 RepID=A0A921GG41_9ACTN|nr:helix-turn-helix domain-containing protein [Thermophilibacter provencensis]HJF46142.1 helix-turn-helix domain-containing protein [Thermophilibacter provencensis]